MKLYSCSSVFHKVKILKCVGHLIELKLEQKSFERKEKGKLFILRFVFVLAQSSDSTWTLAWVSVYVHAWNFSKMERENLFKSFFLDLVTIVEKLARVGSWILVSCHLHRATSGWAEMCLAIKVGCFWALRMISSGKIFKMQVLTSHAPML